MFELIVYLILEGEPSEMYSAIQSNGETCAYNQGARAQHYLSNMGGNIKAFDFADIDNDGRLDYMYVEMQVSIAGSTGDIVILCVNKNKSLQAKENE